MIRLLQYLIFGHVHEWEAPSKYGFLTDRKGALIGSYRECRCAKCGAWRRFEL